MAIFLLCHQFVELGQSLKLEQCTGYFDFKIRQYEPSLWHLCLPKHKSKLIHYNHKQTLTTSKSLSKITLVTAIQSWIHCAVILSISLALGCKIISGTDKTASVWNSGTFARTAALKACKLLRREKKSCQRL